MNEQPVSVTNVSWRDLCPWTNIFHTLPIATSMTVLALALAGVVLIPIGWIGLETVLINDNIRDQNPILAEMAELNRSPFRGVFHDSDKLASANSLNVFGNRLTGPRLVFQSIARPFRMLFQGSRGWPEFLYLLFGCLWTILVWSFIGLGIARVAVLRLTRNERIGLDDAFRFAADKFRSVLSAVGMPLAAVFGLCIPAATIGMLLTFDWGVVVFGALWIVVLIISAIMAVLLLGLFFAWPLMVASTATEGQNSFDSMTRSYAYVFQRPLNYLFYCLLAIFFGGICWLVAAQLANGVVELSYWSTSWGTQMFDDSRMDVIKDYAEYGAQSAGDSTTAPSTGALNFGRTLIGFWNGLVRTLAVAFLYGLFWSMASAIYLLLRHDVDETALDECYIVDEKRTFDLPPLKSDEHGIPQVQTPMPVEPDEGTGGSGEDGAE